MPTTLTAVGTAAATAVAGAVVTQALTKKPAAAATQQQAITQADKPQTAQAPDQSAIAKKNALAASAAGALGGQNSTMLTGSNGIAANALNLGTSTLLGE